MEHNLDPMTMMDFEHSGVEVTQEEMCLEDSVETDSMNMDIVQEQPTIIEGGTEEVIVSDLIGDQYGYQEYSVQTENTSGANITIAANQLGELTTQNSQIIDMQYVEQPKPSSSSALPGLITIKAIQQRPIAKKSAAPVPRQVAIAPKPTKGAPNVQYAIAPKPVTFMVNKGTTGAKTISMKSVVQNLKGNTVLAQIGKQLVVMPAGTAGQKLKLASIIQGSTADPNNVQIRDYAHLVNKGSKQGKPTILGQTSTDPSYQSAVLTKIVQAKSAPTQARYIMQQKTVPISIGGNKVILTSPSKQAGMKVASKKQIISIKAELPKTTTSQANIQTKKIVITANPSSSQLKTTGVNTSTIVQGQRTQLHPINVPGKGIQYIKLVTNQPAVQKASPKPQTVTVGGKSFVLTDNKGNIIQMGADKVISTQPPPLLVTSNTLATKGRKLVRIAPVIAKGDTSVQNSKTLQSLLVPREQSGVVASSSVSLEEYNEMVDHKNNLILSDGSMLQEETVMEEEHSEMDTDLVDPIDIKPTFASLVSDAVGDEAESEPEPAEEDEQAHSADINYSHAPRKQEYLTEDENTTSVESEAAGAAHAPPVAENLIIVPPGPPSGTDYQDEDNDEMTESKMATIESEGLPYLSPDVDKSYSDAMLIYESNSALRPRKACNCTKSQCLKLYCDCFANGEFCNQCNCNNCHNNLHHEDTRQKAIRACLERNPNAFRPKIGKAKAGGPEIVRRHNKGCNCKRSGCLKNYCECYEAKIACTLMCKCVGCRNIEETIERRRDAIRMRERLADPAYRPPLPMGQVKQPCSFLTREVIEAVAQCMLATVTESRQEDADPVEDILVEFSRCMADIISASHQAL